MGHGTAAKRWRSFNSQRALFPKHVRQMVLAGDPVYDSVYTGGTNMGAFVPTSGFANDVVSLNATTRQLATLDGYFLPFVMVEGAGWGSSTCPESPA